MGGWVWKLFAVHHRTFAISWTSLRVSLLYLCTLVSVTHHIYTEEKLESVHVIASIVHIQGVDLHTSSQQLVHSQSYSSWFKRRGKRVRALEKCTFTKCTTFDLSSKAKLKPVLSTHDLETRLDCNALYVGVSRGFRARLQLVAAARLAMNM